uniref:Uncharacterized protein n=1 Tax=Caenorhabditis japonica TaxID=281687 RepID=A0A8R1EG90_CAEJA
NDTLHIRMQWAETERVKKNGDKTSPEIELKYRRDGDDVFEHTKVKPYDSVFHGQFDSVNVGKKLTNVTNGLSTCVPLFVDVISPSEPSVPLATLRFPFFTDENTACHSKLLSEFFHIADYCSSEEKCAEKIWSINYPDPKSDILFGYDDEIGSLR